MKDVNAYLKHLDRVERKENKTKYKKKYDRQDPLQVKNKKGK